MHHGMMLRFSLAGISVTVRPLFWLVAVFLGLNLVRGDVFRPEWVGIAIWVAIVFFGVLAHELGHALVARRFGANVRIELTTFGGFTAWGLPAPEEGGEPPRLKPGLRAVVAVAGSAVGVLIGLATLGIHILGRSAGGWPTEVFFITNAIIWVNLGWGVLNWVPLRPLDGGHILEAGLEGMFGEERAERISVWVFLTLSAVVAYVAWRFGLIIITFLAVILVLSEFRRLAPETPADGPPPVMSYDDPDPDTDSDRRT